MLILKHENTKDLFNCIPIAILPALSQIFEEIVTVRLVKYLETKSILNDQQLGYREALLKSTVDRICILKIVGFFKFYLAP